MFYQSGFHPWIILRQILVLQLMYYMFLVGLGHSLIAGFAGLQPTAIMLFSDRAFDSSQPYAPFATATFFVAALFGALAQMYLVQRSKKCLDFAATLYIIHLGVCCFVAGFPVTWHWWLVVAACFVIQAILSERLCVRMEMREIVIGGKRNTIVQV